MDKVIRFGVSIEPELLNKFDKNIKKKGYTNRSEAIRDIIREKLIIDEVNNQDVQTIGTLTLLYDHHTRNITEKLIELQHNHTGNILVNTHIHINHDNCLEVIVLNGKPKNIKKLSDNIKSLKGIKFGDVVLTCQTI